MDEPTQFNDRGALLRLLAIEASDPAVWDGYMALFEKWQTERWASEQADLPDLKCEPPP